MIGKGLGVIAGVVLLGVADAKAQEYPQKPISVVVPFAAGGPTDTVARLLGAAMGKSLKTQIIVENVGGAGGTIGAARVAKASPDGYTLLLHHIGHATAPAVPVRNLIGTRVMLGDARCTRLGPTSAAWQTMIRVARTENRGGRELGRPHSWSAAWWATRASEG